MSETINDLLKPQYLTPTPALCSSSDRIGSSHSPSPSPFLSPPPSHPALPLSPSWHSAPLFQALSGMRERERRTVLRAVSAPWGHHSSIPPSSPSRPLICAAARHTLAPTCVRIRFMWWSSCSTLLLFLRARELGLCRQHTKLSLLASAGRFKCSRLVPAETPHPTYDGLRAGLEKCLIGFRTFHASQREATS